ncbi:MAG TPA: ABC transporter permease [Bacteroidetes bacterium]|nr:ABC transporter permease [Bacteroidota bacterium]
MNTEWFIARRILVDPESHKSFSRPIILIAIAGIALGLTVMILSVAIVTGFKQEIRDKVVGFGSHIQIMNFDSNTSYETVPISRQQPFLPKIENFPGIRHIQVFGIKAGIIKTENDIEGVVLKGVGPDFDWSFFRENLVAGAVPAITDSARTNQVVISKQLSERLMLNLGDDFAMYFVQEPPRVRRFTVHGIYETSLVDFDEKFILADLQHIQSLNNWENNQISGFEILIDNFDELDFLTWVVTREVGLQFQENGALLKVISIRNRYPQIFDWLNLQDMNVAIILILMFLVAGFNMVSGLLILILERTQMIGILKSLGAENARIRRIFLYQAAFLISRGLFWGNLLGIGLCLLQYHFGIVRLDQASYYLDRVPIHFNLFHLLALNIGTLLLTVLMLVVPSRVISGISPVRAIRFE